ncbi:MAG: hypothetical protein AAGG69_00620 [Pseudomonadota bacterium]
MTTPTGSDAILPLVRFDLPGITVGYHYGGRDFSYNGLIYKANKALQPAGLQLQTGTQIQSRELVFSNVPDGDDVVANLATYQWKRGLVTLSWLIGTLGGDAPDAVLMTEFYEIHAYQPNLSEADEKGMRLATVNITIGPRGTRTRNQGHAMSAQADHQYDNDETDTFFEYVGQAQNWQIEWGQR